MHRVLYELSSHTKRKCAPQKGQALKWRKPPNACWLRLRAVTPIFIASTLTTWLVFFKMPAHLGKVLLLLPATFGHEASHWLVALVTGCNPGFPNLWPRRHANGWVLGTVNFRPHIGLAAMVALAPLLALLPALIFGLDLLVETLQSKGLSEVEIELVCGLIAGYSAHSVLPSSTDWIVALRDPLGLVLVLTLAALEMALASCAWLPISTFGQIQQMFGYDLYAACRPISVFLR